MLRLEKFSGTPMNFPHTLSVRFSASPKSVPRTSQQPLAMTLRDHTLLPKDDCAFRSVSDIWIDQMSSSLALASLSSKTHVNTQGFVNPRTFAVGHLEHGALVKCLYTQRHAWSPSVKDVRHIFLARLSHREPGGRSAQNFERRTARGGRPPRRWNAACSLV